MNQTNFRVFSLYLGLILSCFSIPSFSQITCNPIPEKVIRLSHSDLEKLNIHSDSNGIVYIVNDGDNSYFTLMLSPELESVYGSRSFDSKPNSKEVQCIVACNGSIMHGNFKSYEDYDKTPNTDDMLPVYVPLIGTDIYLIFWFLNTPEIVRVLPSEYRNALQKDASAFRINLVKLLEKWVPQEEEETQNEEAKEKTNNECFADMIKEPNVFEIGKRYKELNIEFANGQYSAGDKNSPVTWRLDGYATGNISYWRQLNTTNTVDLKPLMITPEGGVNYYNTAYAIPVRSKWNFATIHIAGGAWEMEKHRLVGFLLEDAPGERSIAWYAYSPAIKSLLSPEEIKRAESFISWDFTLHGKVTSQVVTDYNQLITSGHQPVNHMAIPVISQGVFKDLGFKLDAEGNLCFPFTSQGFESYILLSNFVVGRSDSMSRVGFDPHTKEMAQLFGKYLVAVTDERGLGPYLVNENVNQYQDWSTLIPVRVLVDKPFSIFEQAMGYSPGAIFWFLPESGIQDKLEKVEGFEWKLKSVQADMTKVKGELTQATWLDPYIYRASWKSSEKVPVTVKIYDLNGLMIYSETLEKVKKRNKLRLSASLLRAGFYTITFTTESGDFHQFPFIIPQKK